MLKKLKLLAYGLLIFFLNVAFSDNMARFLGPGNNGEGYIVAAIYTHTAVVSVIAIVFYKKICELVSKKNDSE